MCTDVLKKYFVIDAQSEQTEKVTETHGANSQYALPCARPYRADLAPSDTDSDEVTKVEKKSYVIAVKVARELSETPFGIPLNGWLSVRVRLFESGLQIFETKFDSEVSLSRNFEINFFI